MFFEVIQSLNQASCFIISASCRTKGQIFRCPHTALLNKILNFPLFKIAEFPRNSRKTCCSPRNKIILEFLPASQRNIKFKEGLAHQLGKGLDF